MGERSPAKLFLQFFLACVAGFLLGLLALRLLSAEEPSQDEAALALREAEWLALKADCFNKETFGPDAATAKDLSAVLLALRTLHPLVAEINVPPPLIRDTAISMTVLGNEAFPREVEELLKMASSSTIHYGEKDGDPIRLYIFFYRLLHVPSLLQKVSANSRVKDAREDRREDEEPNIFGENVTAEKISPNAWRFTFMKSDGDLESTTYHYFYFTVELDRKALSATIQPAVVGYGMKIEKFEEYHETISADGTVQKWGAKPW